MSATNYRTFGYFLLIVNVAVYGMYQPTSLQYQSAQTIIQKKLNTEALSADLKDYVSFLTKQNDPLKALRTSIILHKPHSLDLLQQQYNTTQDYKEFIRTSLAEMGFLALMFKNSNALGAMLPYVSAEPVDKRNSTLLMYAAHDPTDLENAQLIINHGCSVAEPDRDKLTPLMHAAKSDHKSLIEILLAHGASVNSHSHKNCKTALSYAIKHHATESALCLLEKGADPHISDENTLSALELVVKYNNDLLAEKLLSNYQIDTEQKQFSLFGAIVNKNSKIVQLFLNKKMDPNFVLETEQTKKTPLLHALDFNSEDVTIVSSLLEHGALPNCYDKNHRTPLHYAAFCGNSKNVELLLKYKVNTHKKDDFNDTPLIAAASGDYRQIIDLLLQHEPIEDYRQDRQENSLIQGLLENRFRAPTFDTILYTLKRLWPNNEADNFDHIDPDFVAAKHVPLVTAIMYDNLHLFKKHYHADLLNEPIMTTNRYDKKDRLNSLHLACLFGSQSILNFLFEQKADIHYMSERGVTPLHTAILCGDYEIINRFIDHGADLCKEKDGHSSPLNYLLSKHNIPLIKKLFSEQKNCAKVKELKDISYLLAHVSDESEFDLAQWMLEKFKNLILSHKRSWAMIPSLLMSNLHDGNLKMSEYLINFICSNALRNKLELKSDFDRRIHLKDIIRTESLAQLIPWFLDNDIFTISETVCKKKQTPLVLCAKYNYLKAAQTLLAHKKISGCITIFDHKKRTPLIHAAINGHTNIVKLLLSKNSIFHKDTYGRNALMYARLHGHTEIESLLKEAIINDELEELSQN